MATFAKDITDDDFEDKVLNAEGVVLVDFWAPWCGPCKAIAPFIEKIAKEFDGDVAVMKLNIDSNPSISSRLGVRSIPTLIVFRKGEIIKEMTGAPDPQGLVDLLESTLDMK